MVLGAFFFVGAGVYRPGLVWVFLGARECKTHGQTGGVVNPPPYNGKCRSLTSFGMTALSEFLGDRKSRSFTAFGMTARRLGIVTRRGEDANSHANGVT